MTARFVLCQKCLVLCLNPIFSVFSGFCVSLCVLSSSYISQLSVCMQQVFVCEFGGCDYECLVIGDHQRRPEQRPVFLVFLPQCCRTSSENMFLSLQGICGGFACLAVFLSAWFYVRFVFLRWFCVSDLRMNDRNKLVCAAWQSLFLDDSPLLLKEQATTFNFSYEERERFMFAFQRRGADKNLRNESQSLFTVALTHIWSFKQCFCSRNRYKPIANVSTFTFMHLSSH